MVCIGRGRTKCLFCYGRGVVIIGPEKERDTITCPQCNGEKAEVCPRCRGSGKRPRSRFDVIANKEVPNLTNEDVRNASLEEYFPGINADEDQLDEKQQKGDQQEDFVRATA